MAEPEPQESDLSEEEDGQVRRLGVAAACLRACAALPAAAGAAGARGTTRKTRRAFAKHSAWRFNALLAQGLSLCGGHAHAPPRSGRPAAAEACLRRNDSRRAASRTWISRAWTCAPFPVPLLFGAMCMSCLRRRRRKPPLSTAHAQVQSLRKYRRVFKLGDPQTFGSKEELLPSVVRHWQNLVRAGACARARVRACTRVRVRACDRAAPARRTHAPRKRCPDTSART
jgi:hypothetical protein